MNWIKLSIQEWLGIPIIIGRLDAHRDNLSTALAKAESLETQLTELKEALKKKAAQPLRVMPRFVDYESAQVEALADFKEE